MNYHSYSRPASPASRPASPDSRPASPAFSFREIRESEISESELSDQPQTQVAPYIEGSLPATPHTTEPSLPLSDDEYYFPITKAPSPEPTADTLEPPLQYPDFQTILSNPKRKRNVPIERCFRILDVPLAWDRHEVHVSLAERIARLPAKLERLDLYPSPYSGVEKQIGLLTLCGLEADLEKFVQPNEDDVEDPESFGYQAERLRIDGSFHGLTQLNTPVGEVDADVIAIGGFGGHGYETWQDSDTGCMWLRDLLPEDMKGCLRVMTYGYSVALDSTSLTALYDITLDFTKQVELARKSSKDRPLILVGHDLGGIIICRMLLNCRLDDDMRHILDATRLLVFFGTPHGGLRTKELENMATALQCPEWMGLQNMLSLVTVDSDSREHRYHMKHVLEDKEILSFYEVWGTPCVAQDSVTGQWGLTGESVMMVGSIAAQLFLPNEYALPIMRRRNHWEMARFFSITDGHYQSLSQSVESALRSIRSDRSEKRV